MIARVLFPLLITMWLHILADFLAMHAEIQDEDAHHQLQNDLVEYMWRLNGNLEDTMQR
jgi:hypothetical protein